MQEMAIFCRVKETSQDVIMNRTEAQSPISAYFQADTEVEPVDKRVRATTLSPPPVQLARHNAIPVIPPLVIDKTKAQSPVDKRVEEASSAAFQSSPFANPPQQTKVANFYPQEKGA